MLFQILKLFIICKSLLKNLSSKKFHDTINLDNSKKKLIFENHY